MKGILSKLIAALFLFQSVIYANTLIDLHSAIKSGNPQKIKNILKDCKNLLNEQDSDVCSPLHIAVGANKLDAVKALVELGCQLDLKDKFGKSPSRFAKELGYEEIYKFLKSQKAFEKMLGYKFKKRKKLIKACTCRNANPQSNCEIYEILGDTVLHLALTEMLINKYPKVDEGKITAARTALEQNAMLVLLAQKLELDKYIIISNAAIDNVVMSDAIEAIIGAIYKDGGSTVAQQFIERFWVPMLKDRVQPPIDPKPLVKKWEIETGQKCPLVFPKKTANKLPTIQGNLDALEFIKKTLPKEYQELSPILPTDPEYIISEMPNATIVAPNWSMKLFPNSRAKLFTVASILGERPDFERENLGGTFLVKVAFDGIEEIGIGNSKEIAKEEAAHYILNQLNQKLYKDNTLSDNIKKAIEKLELKNETINARLWLKELSDLLKLPKPEYTIKEIENNFITKITCKAMLDNPISGDTKKSYTESDESAASEFLNEWELKLPEIVSTVEKPAKYITALTKYFGIKSFIFEQYRAEGKVTEPQTYFVKVLNSAKEHVLTGEKVNSILEADKNAQLLALKFILKQHKRKNLSKHSANL